MPPWIGKGSRLRSVPKDKGSKSRRCPGSRSEAMVRERKPIALRPKRDRDREQECRHGQGEGADCAQAHEGQGKGAGAPPWSGRGSR